MTTRKATRKSRCSVDCHSGSWINLLLFAAGGAVVWFAGVRLEWLTDETSRHTKLGGAFAGLVLLAAVTSLPEIATVVYPP
jgi:cation:H+ antiporter